MHLLHIIYLQIKQKIIYIHNYFKGKLECEGFIFIKMSFTLPPMDQNDNPLALNHPVAFSNIVLYCLRINFQK